MARDSGVRYVGVGGITIHPWLGVLRLYLPGGTTSSVYIDLILPKRCGLGYVQTYHETLQECLLDCFIHQFGILRLFLPHLKQQERDHVADLCEVIAEVEVDKNKGCLM